MGVGAPFSQEYPVSMLFPSMSLAILGEVYLLIALLLTTPGDSPLVGWVCAGFLMLTHTLAELFPFLQGESESHQW